MNAFPRVLHRFALYFCRAYTTGFSLAHTRFCLTTIILFLHSTTENSTIFPQHALHSPAFFYFFSPAGNDATQYSTAPSNPAIYIARGALPLAQSAAERARRACDDDVVVYTRGAYRKREGRGGEKEYIYIYALGI